MDDCDAAANSAPQTAPPAPPDTTSQDTPAAAPPDPETTAGKADESSRTHENQDSETSDESNSEKDTSGSSRRKAASERKARGKKKSTILLRVEQFGLITPQKTPVWKYFGKYGVKAPQKYSSIAVCRLCLENHAPCELKMGKAMSTSSLRKHLGYAYKLLLGMVPGYPGTISGSENYPKSESKKVYRILRIRYESCSDTRLFCSGPTSMHFPISTVISNNQYPGTRYPVCIPSFCSWLDILM
jgi:hypothetical protein